VRTICNFLRWLIFSAVLLIAVSCGAKYPPRWVKHEPPPAPEGLTVIQREKPRQAILHWNYPQGLAASLEGFTVMRSDGGRFRRIALVTDMRYVDNDLDDRSTYRYMVAALDGKGSSGEAAGPVGIGPVTGIERPVNISFSIGNESVTLLWTYPYDGADNAVFNVYRSTESLRYPFKPLNTNPLKGPSYNVGLHPDKRYYYTVRAFYAAGGLNEGSPSEEIGIGPKDYMPSRPVGIDFAVTDDSVLLFWEENPEKWIKGYGVYGSMAEDGKYVEIGCTRTPAFKDTKATEGERFYRVSAFGPMAEGQVSEAIRVSFSK
jgi:hypothetical protein